MNNTFPCLYPSGWICPFLDVNPEFSIFSISSHGFFSPLTSFQLHSLWDPPCGKSLQCSNIPALISRILHGYLYSEKALRGYKLTSFERKIVQKGNREFFLLISLSFISFSAYGGNYFQAAGYENRQNTTYTELNIYK